MNLGEESFAFGGGTGLGTLLPQLGVSAVAQRHKVKVGRGLGHGLIGFARGAGRKVRAMAANALAAANSAKYPETRSAFTAVAMAWENDGRGVRALRSTSLTRRA